MGFRWFLLRGLAKVKLEWALVCAAYNLKRLHRLAGLNWPERVEKSGRWWAKRERMRCWVTVSSRVGRGECRFLKSIAEKLPFLGIPPPPLFTLHSFFASSPTGC